MLFSNNKLECKIIVGVAQCVNQKAAWERKRWRWGEEEEEEKDSDEDSVFALGIRGWLGVLCFLSESTLMFVAFFFPTETRLTFAIKIVHLAKEKDKFGKICCVPSL